MTELSIRPEEIQEALQRFVSDYKPEEASREEVGTVAEAMDGIARVEGLPSVMANELLEFEDGTLGIALNLDTREIGVVILGDFAGIEEGQQVRRTGEVLSVPVGDGYLGRVVDPLGNALDGLGDVETDARRALELQAPSVVQRQSVNEPHVHRAQGDRLADPDRPRPAPADHRRPPDGQDGDRDRHDHQPEARVGLRRPGPAGPLHLRRHRPEGLDHRRGARRPRGGRRAGVHHDRGGPGVRLRGLQVPRPLHRLRHRPALDVRRQARADHLRRPDQAGRGLPRRVAAAAPPAGSRGLPRRRVLPAQPAARALREAVRRHGRGLDDGSADHRDQGQRRLGIHPDQRHLDHRRPDLPAVRPVQRQPAPGHRRRCVGVPRGW